MPSAWIVKAVDVFEDCDLSIASSSPGPLPEHFCLDRFEEGFNRRIIVTIASSAHRYLEAVLTQDLLVIMRAVLASTIGVVDTALGWSPQSNGHVQGPDRQIAFHPVADSPANHTPRIQIENDCQI